jgi:NAD(P)-dependent dehydrogenase (short-subunit alcohol dehydrogenase family)
MRVEQQKSENANSLAKLTAIITGGGGALCSEMAFALAGLGVSVAILDLDIPSAERIVERITKAGAVGLAIECDVVDQTSLKMALDEVLERFDSVDILINGAGGNHPKATTSSDYPFFELLSESIRAVFDLNFMGTFLACQVFGKAMAEQNAGNIINIASMNSLRPLTKIPAYSAAKAAVANFTQWLAVHMAVEYSPAIRVNALAPGFFLTEQNRYLLMDERSNEVTERGKRILDHIPIGRFGTPQDLISTLLWLLDPSSSYVTGILVPVDGGFSAYSGV